MNSRDPPSHILLLVITQLPQTYPLTNDLLHEIFKSYGDIKKILIFERGKANKCFIEYHEVSEAINARKAMNSKQLSYAGGRLSIHFSKLKTLDLQTVEQSRGTDYLIKDQNKDNSDKPQIHVEKQQKVNKKVTESLDLSPTTDGINNILDSSDDEDIFIWGLPSVGYSAEIQQVLLQRQSPIIRVEQIDDRVTVKMLYNLFSRFGNLEKILFDKQSKAFFHYSSVDHAILAKEYLNNNYLFRTQIRIFYHNLPFPKPQANDDYITYPNVKSAPIQPLSKNLLFTGITDPKELCDMIKLVAKILEIKVIGQNSIQFNMTTIPEALKVIAVFQDFEFKESKLHITFQ